MRLKPVRVERNANRLRRVSEKVHSNSLVILSFLLELVGVLFVLFTNLVELLHVLKEIRTSLQGDEKLGFLAISSLAVTSVV